MRGGAPGLRYAPELGINSAGEAIGSAMEDFDLDGWPDSTVSLLDSLDDFQVTFGPPGSGRQQNLR